MSGAPDNMKVECGRCKVAMDHLLQYDEGGVDTHVFCCPGCSGRVAVQDDAQKPRPKPTPVKIEGPVQVKVETAPEQLEVDRSLEPEEQLKAKIAGGQVKLEERSEDAW